MIVTAALIAPAVRLGCSNQSERVCGELRSDDPQARIFPFPKKNSEASQ
jgi:hypothetical protein